MQFTASALKFATLSLGHFISTCCIHKYKIFDYPCDDRVQFSEDSLEMSFLQKDNFLSKKQRSCRLKCNNKIRKLHGSDIEDQNKNNCNYHNWAHDLSLFQIATP